MNEADPARNETDRLLRVFSSNAAELETNRQGKITPRQRKLLDEYIRIGGCSTRAAIIAFVGSAALMIALPFLMGDMPSAAPALPWIAGTALLMLTIGGVFIGLGKRRLARLREPKVCVADGVAERQIKEIGHQRWKAYHVRIGSVRFQLSQASEYEALADGVHYRIYYVEYPPTHIILSGERV